MADLRRQCFVIARLADYCDYRRADPLRGDDPVLYLWEKLKELEEPMYLLKQELLTDALRAFFAKAADGGVQEGDLAALRHLLDGFLAPGDFADASFHLTLGTCRDLERLRWAEKTMLGLKARQFLDEELKSDGKRSPVWEKLVSDMYKRLEYELLERVIKHKPLSRRRLAFILRRARRNSSDYCAVFHLPLHPEDTFTPFILPRVEALVAANRRFLRKLRRF